MRVEKQGRVIIIIKETGSVQRHLNWKAMFPNLNPILEINNMLFS